MQDITPHRRSSRGALRAPARVGVKYERVAEVHRTRYTRETKIINDVVPTQKAVIKETFTTYDETPIPRALKIKEIESLSSQDKAEALQRALRHAQRALKQERRKRKDLKRFGLVFIASVFVLVTGYVSIDTIMTNDRVKAEISQTSTSGTQSKEEEGKDETKPTAASLTNYSVAASLPRALYIDKLDIASRILPMSVNTDGSVQAPRNIFDAGWYNGSVKPGEIGAMFIDAHASGPTREGLFAYLDKLTIGDEVQVEKGDGERLTYRVVHTETVSLADVDMKRALLPYGNALRGLNLMTCTGKWVDGEQTYDKRVIVYTEQV